MLFSASYPLARGRRLRQASWVRDLVAETTLNIQDLVWPLFVRDNTVSPDIPSMPGVKRLSLDELPAVIRQAEAWGVPAVALFPAIDPSQKCPEGAVAVDPRNLICQALQCARAESQHVGLIADVALDPFTSHGHDGVIRDNKVDNDTSVAILREQALVQARAGADVLAPSDMMDGRVGVIRKALEEAGLQDKLILSYAAKYVSNFYGPYREALHAPPLTSGPRDKRTYQLNPANRDEALREVAQDIAEGADMVMVKPALPYLDVLTHIVDRFALPTFAYHVTGEYAMIQAAAQQGWLQADAALYESLLSIKRAGAAGIFTYAVPEMAKFLK